MTTAPTPRRKRQSPAPPPAPVVPQAERWHRISFTRQAYPAGLHRVMTAPGMPKRTGGQAGGPSLWAVDASGGGSVGTLDQIPGQPNALDPFKRYIYLSPGMRELLTDGLPGVEFEACNLPEARQANLLVGDATDWDRWFPGARVIR